MKIAIIAFLILGAIPAGFAAFFTVTADTDMARSMAFFPLFLAIPLWILAALCGLAHWITIR
jgi:hypothetical protein